jgi:RNA polymerase sigma-70 factor (sigma-E family)
MKAAGERSGMRPGEERDYTEYVSGRLAALHRTAYLLCGDSHRADDIVQATLTTIYVQWKRVVGADNVDAYVHRILVRRYLIERRKWWSRVRLGATGAEAATTEAPEHGVVVRSELVTALRALPAGQRAVVVLRYFGDLTVRDTAEALQCSEGNVKSQCARGLAALRETLQRQRRVTTGTGMGDRR